MSDAWDTKIRSYLCGSWQSGTDDGHFAMINPATGAEIAHGSMAGIDLSGVLDHARTVGSPALRAMTFGERGELLASVAKALHGERERLISVAIANGGNTRKDAKFDVDGATGTLQYYANLGKELGDRRFLTDGEGIKLGRTGKWWGQHILVPRQGAAVHINAFNFPAWGTFEKAAVAWLAGMPVVTKPASATALLAYEMTKIIVEAEILPAGALQLVSGSIGDLLDYVGHQDVLAFTGSSWTGQTIRKIESVVARGVAVNVEADSLNSAVLGADVSEGSETWHLFLNDVSRDLTQKAGQKCTAIRRIMVPEALADSVQSELVDRLSAIRVGDPALKDVDMGPVTNARQQRDVLAGIKSLVDAGARQVYGTGAEVERTGGTDEGSFVSPTLLRVDLGVDAAAVHEHEVFGPCATLVVYDGTAASAVDLVNRGQGSLVSSLFSDDAKFCEDVVLGISAYNGRVYIGDERCAAQTMGPGTVLPMMVHGGPGRAGCGEELGGLRGLSFYMQRTALQGSRKFVSRTFGG